MEKQCRLLIQNGSYTNANQRTTDDAPKNTVSHGKPEGTSRFQARLDYNRKFGDHNVTAMLLYYMQNKIVNNEVPFRYMGMSARATYDYKNKYLFEFNLGYNGSENFARGHRFGVFPAGSIGWVVSQEEFMKNVSWIDHLKLRASFGLVGNDQMPDNLRFAYLQYYSSDDNMNIYFGENRKPYGTTLIEGVFANPSLTWEKARKFNFGIVAVLDFGVHVDVAQAVERQEVLSLCIDADALDTGFRRPGLGQRIADLDVLQTDVSRIVEE